MRTPFSSSCSADRNFMLAIDTAFDMCTVALVTSDTSDIRRSERIRKHADDILPMIDRLLSEHQLTIASLDVLAMVSGPGSFTGLRIGTAVVQGLAFGAGLPVVCVSSLAMIVRATKQSNEPGVIVFACIHAREDEFYFAAYRDTPDDSPRALLADTIFTNQQIEHHINDLMLAPEPGTDSKPVFAGAGWQHELLAGFVASQGAQSVTVNIDAIVLAEIALQDYKAGRAVDASLATPAYLKDDLKYRTV